MTGGVEHHSYPLAISVGWLPGCLGATELQSAIYGDVEVVDLHLEMHHLRQFARLLRPRRRLVPRVSLDVDVYASVGVEQLRPPSAGAKITDLEAKESLIEARHRSGPFAVDC